MKNKIIYSALVFIVFVTLIFRAIYVPLVHDELATFFYYIQPFEYNPLAGAHPDANNHILNSLLSGITHKLFGYSELSLRLPNLISFLIFAFFVFKLGEKLQKNSTKWALYIALTCSLYFVQFFGLCRGYGLSMAFLIGGFYYTYSLFESKLIQIILLNTACLILALFSNLALLPLILILFLIQGVLVLKGKINLLKLVPVILFSLAMLILGILISFKMKNEGALYYGELDGYWEITVKSVLLMLFENKGTTIQIGLLILLVGTGILNGYLIWKEKIKQSFKKENLFLILLIGVVFATILMAKILHVNYPEDRVGIYIFPLLVLTICFGVDRLNSKLKFILLLPLFLLPLHFIISMNLTKVSIWQKDNIPNRFYEVIKNHKNNSKYPATVGGKIQRVFVYSYKLYGDTSNQNQIGIIHSHKEKYNDYIISNSNKIKTIAHLYDSIDRAEISNYALFKRKKPTKKHLFHQSTKESGGETMSEFFELLRKDFDSLNTNALMVGIDAEIQSLQHPFHSRIVVEVIGKNNDKQISYDFIQLNWISPKTEKKNPIIQSVYLHDLPKNKPIEVVVYLWNIDKKPFTVYKSEIELYKVKEEN